MEPILARLRKAIYMGGKKLPDSAFTTVLVGDLRKLIDENKRLRDVPPNPSERRC